MPIYDKIGGYTLKGPFVAGGGIYTSADAEKLALWVRFRSTPADESGNSLTVSYDGSPVTNNQLIPNKAINRIGELPVATFSDSANTNAKVTGTTQLIFNNGSKDTPFTISAWIRRNSELSQPVYAQENVAGSGDAISFEVRSTLGIRLRLFDSSGNMLTAAAPTGDITTHSSQKFTHIAVTYDGSESHSGVTFYVNGTKLVTQGSVAAGYTFNDTNSVQSHYIGAYSNGSNEFIGEMSEFCIWRKELTPSAIKAIYHSTAGRYTARTGIVSLPNRVRLREVDSLTGSYPTYSRTTGVLGDKKGDGPFTFDDTTTQLFKSADDVIFPLVQTEANLRHADLDNLIASPNQNSDLQSYGTASNYLSSQGLRKHINYGMNYEPFDETRVFLKDKTSAFYASGTSGSVYPGFGSPLRDKIAINIPIPNKSEKIIARYSNYGLIHDPAGLFPVENGHNTSGFYYYNFNDGTWEDKGLATNNMTQMHYRATVSGTFPGLNNVRLGRYFGDGASGTHNSDLWTKAQQFKMSDHTGVLIDSKADLKNLNHGATASNDPYSLLSASLGYHLIGAPTNTGLAPWHHRYHATGSQCIEMNDYLSREFLLEKAVIDIPVIVNRQRGGPTDGTGNRRYFNTCRDIDNYTFFLYKQRRVSSAQRDSASDMTGSKRELIASGCASFYNSNAFSGRVPEAVRQRGLPHGPSFSHDWNESVIFDGNPGPSISAFTGTIRIEMQAAIPNAQPIGGSRFPILSSGGWDNLPGGYNSVVVQDYWTGGTTALTQSLTETSTATPAASIVNKENLCGMINNQLAAGLIPFVAPPGNPLASIGTPYRVTTERSLLPFEGSPEFSKWPDKVDYLPPPGFGGVAQGGLIANENSIGVLGYTGPGNQYMPILFGGRSASRASPYLLDPEDELIIGIDAGISMLPVSSSGQTQMIARLANAGSDLGYTSASSPINTTWGVMSGSFMKLLVGEAHLTLFGSEVREEREQLLSTNQNLTTDAVHEIIGGDRVLDQFETYSRFDLTGSYLDRFIGGNIGTPNNETNMHAGRPWQQNMTLTGSGRRVICQFSRNWAGTPKQSNNAFDHSALNKTPFADPRTGFPPINGFTPSPSGVGQPGNQYITKDPFGLGPYKAIVLQSSEINSLQRFVVIPNSSEIYYDSMAPDIVNLSRRSRSLIAIAHRSSSFDTPFIQKANEAGSSRGRIDWPYRTNPTRFINQRFWLRQYASVHEGAGNPYWDFDPKHNKLIKMFVLNSGINVDQGEEGSKIVDLRRFRHGITGAFGPTYGMISPMIQKSSMRYRASSYGQYRDMLEQRLDTKYFVSLKEFVDNTGFSPHGLGHSVKSVGLQDSPVQVTFVSQEDGVTIVDPFSTDSANFSSEYTSSYPYSDGNVAPPVVFDRYYTVITTKADFGST